MNLDGLLRVGNVVPVPVGFPALGNDLDQHAAQGCIRHMRNASLIGLDVDLEFFVLEGVLFEGLDVDAGVFHGLIGVAARDFDGQAIERRGGLVLRGRGLRILLGDQRSGDKERQKEE